jgi:Cu/Zn superoxide dismutase
MRLPAYSRRAEFRKILERAMRRDRLCCVAATLLATMCLSLPATAQVAKATLSDANGKAFGEVSLIQTNDGVLIRLSLKGLPAGERAFHVHAVGKCEPPFTSAGPHFNPGGKKHGLEAADDCGSCGFAAAPRVARVPVPKGPTSGARLPKNSRS